MTNRGKIYLIRKQIFKRSKCVEQIGPVYECDSVKKRSGAGKNE